MRIRSILPAFPPALIAAVLALSPLSVTLALAQEREPPPAPDKPESVRDIPGAARLQDLALKANEPMYFAIGGDAENTTARLQFSFAYRFLDAESAFVEEWPLLGKLHFAYTQTSVWDLSETSRPFRDSSYRPSLYLEFDQPTDGAAPDIIRTGYEHESNGQAAEVSRGVDMLFFQPGWYYRVNDRLLLIAPKFRVNLSKSEYNEDIGDYRGYVDLYLRYGREESWITALTARYGKGGHGSLTIEASYPLRKPIFTRTGGYFYVQVFHGYGETLLNYNEHAGTQLRVGLAIVR